ncbi:uncharacterized protein B0H18DRAFT_478372 [Fomitopsis serialis]|uniref:uncharacterized protein n=1 Tax=Fomitopsis serialis TaxID=139415 RepID=UPI002008D19A|nr:uncharacterized protein B0H18DRAFT_478372 [Neoantrodia serialis]KAH9923043.1 hypothetical protein B0H18DRAFT_478372 [Neoantrodia serialis]
MWPQQGFTMEHSFVAARCETMHQNLHTLQLPFHSAADVPLRYLPRLTDLGLLIMKTPDELASVLRQLPQLRSLSFYSLASQEAELFAALSTLKSDLPNLTSFAIHTGDVGILEMPYTEMFDSFLRDRRELRRLYCSLEVPPESLGLYLDTIRTLKNLELFFLLLTSQPYTAEFFENLLSHLPARLVGMGLTSSGLLSDASVFDQLWTHFTDFQYLYIRTWEATDVEAEAITKGTKSLQLLGYNGRFYDVEYPHGKPALLPPWSARKVAFRNARDFGCEGWERFMSYLAIEP